MQTGEVRRPQLFLSASVYQRISLTRTRDMNEMLSCFYDAGLATEMAVYAFRVPASFGQDVTTEESIGYAIGRRRSIQRRRMC